MAGSMPIKPNDTVYLIVNTDQTIGIRVKYLNISLFSNFINQCPIYGKQRYITLQMRGLQSFWHILRLDPDDGQAYKHLVTQ